VMAAAPLVPRLRSWRAGNAFLDGVNAAAWALILFVGVTLAGEVLDSWFTSVLFAAALVLAIGTRLSTAWLVLGGIATGLAYAGLS